MFTLTGVLAFRWFVSKEAGPKGPRRTAAVGSGVLEGPRHTNRDTPELRHRGQSFPSDTTVKQLGRTGS